MAYQPEPDFTRLPPLAMICGLCGDIIYGFSTTRVSDITYHDKPDVFSKEKPWIYGDSTDLNNIHFGEMWVWTSIFRAGKYLFFPSDLMSRMLTVLYSGMQVGL